MRTFASKLMGKRGSPPPPLKDPTERRPQTVEVRKLQEDLTRRPMIEMENAKKEESLKRFWGSSKLTAGSSLKKTRQIIDFGVKGVGAIVEIGNNKVATVKTIGQRWKANLLTSMPVMELSKNFLGKSKIRALSLSATLRETSELVAQRFTTKIGETDRGIRRTIPIAATELDQPGLS